MARNTGYEYKLNIPRPLQTSCATIEFGNFEECGRCQKQNEEKIVYFAYTYYVHVADAL